MRWENQTNRFPLSGLWVAALAGAALVVSLTHLSTRADHDNTTTAKIRVPEEPVTDGPADDLVGAAGEASDNPQPVESEPGEAMPDDGTSAQAATDDTAGDQAAADNSGGAAPQDPGSLPAPSIESAKFKGLQPGVTALADAEAALGVARESRDEEAYLVRSYLVEPFKLVTVWYEADVVASIVVDLAQSFPDAGLAEQLGLTPIESVTVPGADGQPLGLSFPERGVLFSYAPDTADTVPGQGRSVTQLILDRVDSEPFVLRAETHRRLRPQAALADLARAAELDPDSPRVAYCQARLLLDQGELPSALAASERAARAEPGNPEFVLVWAQALGQLGEFVDAETKIREVLATGLDDPLLVARAELAWGDLLAAGADRDYHQALDHHLEAIKRLEPLRASGDPHVRQEALERLLEGHLALANDVAWGRWKSKSTVVPQWLERAEGVAASLEQETGNTEYRWDVARATLAADTGMQGQLRPARVVDQVNQLGQALLGATQDTDRRMLLSWKWGLALYDAAQAEHSRGQPDQALPLAERAVELIEPVLAARRPTPHQAYSIGRLYFRLGSTYAIHLRDHATAVTWFDKATPLLEEPLPPSAQGDASRLGETFVSMGVSYWETERQDEAIRLTEQGTSMLEQSVREGSAEAATLGVPYANLASMHRQLGHEDQALNYDRLAKQLENDRQR